MSNSSLATSGNLPKPERLKRELPKKGKVKRYVLTCAQNNTNVNLQVWNNLLAYANEVKAEVMVSRFTYNKAKQSAKGAKRKTSKETDHDEEWWAGEVLPFVQDCSIELAPYLVWCGELQILPTAVRPLSGFESYTGRRSSIIPHTKFAVQTVPSPKHAGTKFNYTTGTVTQRNYIQKTAGQKAEFHHGYGAVLVEVDAAGTWFVRQLNADSDGVIYDLDAKVDAGKVTYGHVPEAIVWGDIHHEQLAPEMEHLCWGKGGIMATLQPKRQVMHDLLDFRSQNHHDKDDAWKTFAKWISVKTNVAVEVENAARFLSVVSEGALTYVVRSNHDEALDRWLKESDFRDDPENAEVYLETTLAAYQHMRREPTTPWNPMQWLMQRDFQLPNVRFMKMDQELTVKGIELGMHGHVGANGARGSQAAFAKSGRKSIVGHSHSPWQHEGAMGVGVMGALDMGYNKGMSSWSHTFALVYPNGKRTLITIYDDKWRGK